MISTIEDIVLALHGLLKCQSKKTCRGIQNQLEIRIANSYTRLITAALSHDFVMSALLALSALHLAWQTKNPDTENLAYHHRGVALKGLHEAIGAFSRENSDAILAASMLLSWQATEWCEFITL